MPNSLYKIAEQCRVIMAKGDMQSIIASVIDVYASLVRQSWYENKSADVAEIDGVFLTTFQGLIPVLDPITNYYYIENPSSYLRLPCELGINFVGNAQGQDKPFVRISAGGVAMWANLKANVLGGAQPYFIEGARTYFPKMTNYTNQDIMVRYAVALDQVDVEADLDIPPNIVDQIVNMVVAKYSPKPPVVPENLN